MLYKKQTLTQIQLDTEFNVSAATEKKILYKKPDGTKGAWIATVQFDTILSYSPGDNEIDQEGIWSFQAYVVLDSKKGYGEVVTELMKLPID